MTIKSLGGGSLNKRLAAFSLILAIAAAISLPATAFADEAVSMGADALETGVNSAGAQAVYFGGNAWYVIGYAGEGVVSDSGTATLLAAENRGLTKYDPDTLSNTYGTSALRAQVNAVANALTSGERAVVLARDLDGGSANYGSDGYDPYCISGDFVTGALLWPLSAGEADTIDGDLRKADPANPDDTSSYWWLRSPGSNKNAAANVHGDGSVDYDGWYPTFELGVRPAFNLDLNSVAFTSAAEGGKSSGVAIGEFSELSEASSVSAWKLTLKDPTRTVTASAASGTAETAGYTSWSVPITFSDGGTNSDDYVSVILCKADGTPIYYGTVANATASGTQDMAMPTGLAAGTYTLKVFSEQRNGDQATDYAGDFVEIALTVAPAPAKYTVSVSASPAEGGTATGGGTYEEGASVTVSATPATGYSFANWTDAKGNEVSTDATYTFTAESDCELTANFAKQSFTVTFVDEDGTVLQSGLVEYGEKPKFEGAEPTKAATAENTYKFAGWTPEIVAVTGDATYTATYEAVPIEATLTFDLAGGTLDGKTGVFTVVANVGETIKLPGTPTRKGYTFKYWKGSKYAAGAEYEVKGDHEFTAEWEKAAKPSSDKPKAKDKSETKTAIPKTGDPLAGVLAPITALAIASALLLALAVCAPRRNSCKGRHSR